MSVRLNRVDYRARLEPRREPRWHPLSKGRYVGFRRLTTATPGTWLARFYNGDGYKQKPLSDFATLPENERFDAAVAAAQEWFKHLDQGGSTERVTVKAACEAYAKWLRDERSESAARDAEGHFKRLVYGNPEKDIEPDPLARIELAKLRPEHVNAWRERIRKRGTETYFNRNLTTLRAALNKAKDDGLVAGDFAWSKALRPIKIGSKQGRRTLYLDRAQRRKLIEKASKELRPLLLAWILLPLRPGEIAKCRVEHIDLRHGILHVPEGKTESRDVPLGREAFEHLRGCAKNKLPSAWLISRTDASQWKKEAWRDALKEAVTAAKLPKATVAYTLRHSTITDLVTSGVNIFTVAKISGTSVAMIEKHYGHLQDKPARDALDHLSLGLKA